MRYLLAGGFALALVVCAGTTGTRADDKKDKDAGPTGTWTREANGLDLKFEFVSKDKVKVSAFGGENGLIVTCSYTVDKDGVVKAKVLEFEEKGNFPAKPEKGFEFSFKWAVKGDTATLSDLKGEGLDDAKAVFEGEFARKKDAKKKD